MPLKHQCGDISAEYSASERSKCKRCWKGIDAGDLRFGVWEQSQDFDGLIVRWYHVPCYFKRFLGKPECVKSSARIMGLQELRWKDQVMIKTTLGEEINADPTDVHANELRWKVKDALERVGITVLRQILKHNDQPVTGGTKHMMQRCVEGMLYGALPKCSECKEGDLYWDTDLGKYRCTGDISEWARCTFTAPNFDSIERTPWKMPSGTGSKFLDNWEMPKEKLPLPQREVASEDDETHQKCTAPDETHAPSQQQIQKILFGKSAVARAPAPAALPQAPVPSFPPQPVAPVVPQMQASASTRAGRPFSDLQFAIAGRFPKTQDALKKDITSLGGKFSTSVTKKVNFLIASESDVAKGSVKSTQAKNHGIHVVSLQFLQDCIAQNKLVDPAPYSLTGDKPKLPVVSAALPSPSPAPAFSFSPAPPAFSFGTAAPAFSITTAAPAFSITTAAPTFSFGSSNIFLNSPLPASPQATPPLATAADSRRFLHPQVVPTEYLGDWIPHNEDFCPEIKASGPLHMNLAQFQLDLPARGPPGLEQLKPAPDLAFNLEQNVNPGPELADPSIYDPYVLPPKHISPNPALSAYSNTPGGMEAHPTPVAYGGSALFPLPLQSRCTVEATPTHSQAGTLSIVPAPGPAAHVARRAEKEKVPLNKRVVNASSGLATTHHVHEDNDGSLYNMVLSNADISSQQNSYYFCQVLVPDSGRGEFCVWFKWGRVGTDIGKDKTETFRSSKDAVEFFSDKFFDKTGNKWEDRASFKKVPRAYFPVEVDYSEEDNEQEQQQDANVPTSNLDPRVYQLVSMLFDTEKMKSTMARLGLDTQRMPLGKLTRRHVLNGYQVLKELEVHLQSSAPNRGSKLLECSNRFYTIVPHSFEAGRAPPVINTPRLLIEKMSMLEALADIEVASTMLREDVAPHSGGGSSVNPVDLRYYKLRTDIEPVEEGTPEHALVCAYLRTNVAADAGYRLVPEAVFHVARHGDAERYTFHRTRQNKRLLWHGSRLTNYIGILSQGLRVAPPEAPVSGYMFGKGIYFADMASKSADFCHATPADPRGLLLLCEASLGNALEVTTARYVEPSELAASGRHSTKALGLLGPERATHQTMEDGVVVPIGREVPSGVTNSDLAHNEYIVYDSAQALQRYLIQVRFEFDANYKERDLTWVAK
eukprot:TRINITY_DN255_c0_g1_i1.p1 TRINITY_DN255_c0_g1~~TRINITY_DN255_c0_g1_i1.p1  ORF type:complete len:1160 (+),score=256.88 TRINITY_DN255_c0_g1_i1:63-3542(+)